MTNIRFIGDIHGNFRDYVSLLDHPNTVQIGDFGIGFGDSTAPSIDEFLNAFEEGGRRHRFIRGNHDDPDEAKKSTHYIQDGTIEGDIMYLGGASSIDRAWRTEGVSWWSGEELTYPELSVMIDLYAKNLPPVLVTHECTESFASAAMIPLVRGITNFPSRTREALEQMYAIRPPKVHIFGHWHHPVDYVNPATGTRMICIDVLKHMDMEF